MAKYMQDSTDIQINEISGTDNINFTFKNGNSIDTKIGNLEDLETTDKSNIVGAINEANLEEYSTGEKIIGKWINGKKIYRKVISIGSLPNNTSKNIPTEIDFNNATLVKMYGFCKYQSNNTAFPLPFANPVVIGYSIMLNIDNDNNIVVTTGTDRTGYFGYVVLEYTKTTD